MEIQENRKLIYDVGLHKGEDTDFYLKKGFDVVAFEANPDLIKACKQRFKAQMESGQLTIVEGAITDTGVSGKTKETISFYRNIDDSVWGTVCEEWADRNEKLGTHSEIIQVPAINFADCIRKYGVPYYMKIDIEGMDTVCLKALLEFEQKPAYISIESEKRHFDKLMEEIHLFRQLGYDHFKAVQQSGISKQKEPNPPLEGLKTSYDFKEGSSGLFGKDLPGKWKNFDQIIKQYKRIFFLYENFGDFGRWRRKIIGRVFREEITSWILQKPIPGWYDTHARHQSVTLKNSSGSN